MRGLMPVAALAGSLVVLAACGPKTTAPEDTAEMEPPRAYGDLPAYEGDPFVGFSEVVSVELPAEAEEESPETTQDAVEPAASSGPFSVQIMALADEATARGVAESVSDESGLPGHVDREGAYWKVRLGNFADRSEAAENLPLLVGLGFDDAWVVRRR